MRYLNFLQILILTLLILTGCKTGKEAVCDKSLEVDSVAYSADHRTIFTIDSMMHSTTFDFDTLEVSVERPSSVADRQEIFRLKAVRGRVTNNTETQRSQLENYNRLDTLAYKKSASDFSTEHTTTTRIYNPPSATAICIVTILAALIIVFFKMRKK